MKALALKSNSVKVYIYVSEQDNRTQRVALQCPSSAKHTPSILVWVPPKAGLEKKINVVCLGLGPSKREKSRQSRKKERRSLPQLWYLSGYSALRGTSAYTCCGILGEQNRFKINPGKQARVLTCPFLSVLVES